ncbi:hypothetical protein EZV62_018789 [Acer yangbiense]|uniref:HhH-GPD domain-containing protein n=1 Tax=Acer yangbiense TaxID=1000413 RepID=A0A5C7H8S8_9ROSI|nr:hypothetical protein EZV62_018789 [Acer yangbiense]
MVRRIFHPQETPNSLHVKVYNTGSVLLSSKEQETLLGQVARMLRLSETDERNVREFERIVSQESEESDYMKNFGGRVFRSPTLFEDMVKCILLLGVAALFVRYSDAEKIETENFIPITPVGKESKRKVKMSKVSTNLTSKIARIEAGSEEYMKLDCVGATKHDVNESSFQINIEDDLHTLNELSTVRSASEGRESYACDRIGNFPSPRELANLDRRFLAKRCGLGCRAGRILKLAQAIVEGRIQLKQLEEICNEASLTSYDKLSEQLSKIDGFGPFTCANVLVCMGFYHVIPSDSETIRHLKQVHARKSTVKTIQIDVERIHRNCIVSQLVRSFCLILIGSELWHLYEQRFGKLSKMPYANYKLITASNMITNRSRKVKKSKKC